MKENIELLNYIYQNCKMGILSLEQIMELTDDPSFTKTLKKQLSLYDKISDKVIKEINNKGCVEKDISTFTKIKTYFMINVQAISDKSTSHLAEMLIIGSTMGVIDTVKNLRKYEDSCEAHLNLLNELHQIEEKNIFVLKQYL